jgi:hypothetical protein
MVRFYEEHIAPFADVRVFVAGAVECVHDREALVVGVEQFLKRLSRSLVMRLD